MHPAASFHEADPDRLMALVGGRAFALISAVGPIGPLATHAPVIIRGESLDFHLSQASAVATALLRGSRALAVVLVDDAYVSPDWYAVADQVPTWNYRSVEIDGPVDVLGRDDLISLLDALSSEHEARLAPKPPWTRAKMDPSAFERLLGGIVGFRMRIERIEGTIKLSQNKLMEQRRRVAESLEGRPEPGAQSIARAMRASIEKPSSPT